MLAEVERATAAGHWAFGFLGYEAAAGLDPVLPVLPPDPDGSCPWPGSGCAQPPPRSRRSAPADPAAPVDWQPDWSDADHRRAVGRVREHIAAGDTYQVNLTDRLRAHVIGDPAELYAGLAVAQGGAHSAYLDLGRHVIASASPELFFEWDGDHVRTRPMKGTAARGRTADDDRRQAERLQSSPKERAENLMIVDLLRNDLSRIARVGSVDVPGLFAARALPDGVAADLGDHRPDPDRRRGSWTCSARCSPAARSPVRPSGPACSSSGTWRPARAGSTAGPSDWWPHRGRPSAHGSASRSAPWSSTGRPVLPCTARVARSPGAPTPDAERAELQAKAAILRGRLPRCAG